MPLVARLVLIHGLGYFRWTQWLAVLVLWISLGAMLAAFAFVNFQEQGVDVLEALAAIAGRLPWLPSVEGIGRNDAEGAFYLDDGDVRTLLVRYWALGSALFYAGSLFIGRLIPNREPWGLGRRLLVLVALGVLTWCAFMAIYATSGETFHGSTLRWMLTFAAMCAIVVVASGVAVTIATAIEWVIRQVERAGETADAPQPAASA